MDQVIKRWHKVAKAGNDPSSPVYEALAGIPMEPSTPVPDPMEIDTVAQGGEDGEQVLVSYLPGGGAHATTRQVQWQDADFTHTPRRWMRAGMPWGRSQLGRW